MTRPLLVSRYALDDWTENTNTIGPYPVSNAYRDTSRGRVVLPVRRCHLTHSPYALYGGIDGTARNLLRRPRRRIAGLVDNERTLVHRHDRICSARVYTARRVCHLQRRRFIAHLFMRG